MFMRDVGLVVYIVCHYREVRGCWPSLQALGKILANLTLSRTLGHDVFEYPTAFRWKAGRFGGYAKYDSFLFRSCSLIRFLRMADDFARKYGFRIIVVFRSGRKKCRIVKVEDIESRIDGQ